MNRLVRTETPLVLEPLPADRAGEHCRGMYCRPVSCQQAPGRVVSDTGTDLTPVSDTLMDTTNVSVDTIPSL